MSPVLTLHEPARIQTLRRVVGPVALALVVVAAFALLLDLVAMPPTVQSITLENRAARGVEVGLEAGEGDGILWIAALEPRSTATVEDVLDVGRDWVLRTEHAGRPVGELRLSRSELERRDWRIVVPTREA